MAKMKFRGKKKEGKQTFESVAGNKGENEGRTRKVCGKDTDGEEAVTGPGATGKLSGATESARQEP